MLIHSKIISHLWCVSGKCKPDICLLSLSASGAKFTNLMTLGVLRTGIQYFNFFLLIASNLALNEADEVLVVMREVNS